MSVEACAQIAAAYAARAAEREWITAYALADEAQWAGFLARVDQLGACVETLTLVHES